MAGNPLASIQREHSGSLTYSKYQYQYHWALCRIIEEYEKDNEFAVFVELHEDVVVSNSLDPAKAKFEFNQIKTNQAKLNANDLTKRKKSNSKKAGSKAANSNSVLAKLIMSGVGQPFSNQVSEINLVSANGFSPSLVDKTHNSSIIKLSDLIASVVSDLESKMQAEVPGFSKLPVHLSFIKPSLPDSEFQDIAIGKISKVIESQSPLNRYDSVSIYRTLIDDLNRKGIVLFDFPVWEDLIKNKGVIHSDVKEIFSKFTLSQNDTAVRGEFMDLVKEMGYSSMDRRDMWQSYQRYSQRRFGISDIKLLSITKKVSDSLSKNTPLANRDAAVLVQLVFNDLPGDVKSYFVSSEDAKAAIIFEYLNS